MTRSGACLLALVAASVPRPAAAGEEGIEVEVVAVDRPREGFPLAGARVAVARVEGEGPFDPDRMLGGGGVVAGEDGRARTVAPPGPGRVVVAAVAPGYAPALGWAGPAGGPVRVALRDGLPFEVRVRDPAGGPIRGAEVLLRPGRGYEDPGVPPRRRRAVSGGDGDAHFRDLDAGPFWELEVRAPGRAPARESFLLAGGAPVVVALPLASRVAGRVVRVPGGEPVAGARVRAGEAEGVTDADGAFVLGGLPPGTVAVEASAEGTLALDRPVVRAEPGKAVPVPDIRLATLGTVRVALEDPRGVPVPDARVRLLPPDDAPAAPGARGPPEGVTGSDGRAELDGVVPAAGHRLVVEPARDLAPLVTDAFAVLPGEEADLGAVRLDGGGVLEGLVVDPEGLPVPGARLLLFDGAADPLRVAAGPAAGGPLRREVAVGPLGTFRVERVPSGPRTLLARAPGRLSAVAGPFPVAAGRTREGIRLVLRFGAAAGGTLLDEEGVPVADALLAALLPPLDREGPKARTGPSGSFLLEGLPPGEVRVRVTLPGEKAPDPLRPLFPLAVPVEGAVIRLPARRALEGVVVDPEGEQVRGVVVVARVEAGPAAGPVLEALREVARIEVGEDGRFETVPLPAGRYRLRAETDDGRVAAADAEVGPFVPDRVTLLLTSGARVRGRILTGPVVDDLSAVSVRLRVAGRREAAIPPAVVRDDGTFVLSGVPPGEHDLVVSLPGLAPAVIRGLAVPPEGGVIDVGDVVLGRGTTLRVRVYDESRAPLEGAVVAAVDAAGLRREETTGAAGVVIFAGLSEGPLVLELRLPSGAIHRRPVEVPPEIETEEVFDFGLDPPGTVFVRRSGGPVPGASVRVLDAVRGAGAYAASVEVVADDAGRARVPALPEGPVLVEVVPPGEPPVRLSVEVQGRTVLLELPADGIEGTVEAAESGDPIPGARVRAFALDDAGSAVEEVLRESGVDAVTDAGGRFAFPSLPPGSWTLEVAARGRATVRVPRVRVLAGGGATRVSVQVPPGGRLRGFVRDGTGRPVPGAAVEATELLTGDLLPGGRRTAGAGGEYLLDGIRPGSFVVTARAGAVGASRPETVSLAPGEERELDLWLVPGGTLLVRVVGRRGEPVGDAAVSVADFFGVPVPMPEAEVRPGAPLVGEGRTGPDGLLRVPGLRAGVYLVRARKGALEAEVRVRVDPRGGAVAVVTLLPPEAPEAEDR